MNQPKESEWTVLPQKAIPDDGPAEFLKLVTPEMSLEFPSLSPSVRKELPAYEMKFLLTETQAKEVEDRARIRMVSDPHARLDLGNAYQTTSLYCDTAQLDVFHRMGKFKRRKHRLRRYGNEPVIFLERKTKKGERVKKRRSVIPHDELPLMINPMSVMEWPGHWFHRHLLKRGLFPVCRIAYERIALVGQSEEGPMRLTFDRRVRGTLTREWNLEPLENGQPVLTDAVICEFKYQAFLPSFFKEIIQAMCLTPTPVSKYRTFLRVSGISLSKQAEAPAMGIISLLGASHFCEKETADERAINA